MSANPVAFLRSENARLKDENDRLQNEVRSLRDFAQVLNDLYGKESEIKSDADLLPLLNRIFQKMLALLNAPDGSLLIMDEETNELVFVLVAGELAEELEGYRIPADEGIAGWVVERAGSALVRDVRRDNRFSHMVDEQFKFRTQSIAAAPLIGDGKVLGVVEALNQPGDVPFTEADMVLLELLCRAAGERLAAINRMAGEQA
jgi:GAF domain-containing protein